MFTWSEKSGIQFYENGNLKQQSKEPSQFIEAKFTRDSEFFYVGANREIDAPNMFDVANLFVLKRFALPNEATSLAYNGNLFFVLQMYLFSGAVFKLVILKALSHDAIFLATYKAILLLGDV